LPLSIDKEEDRNSDGDKEGRRSEGLPDQGEGEGEAGGRESLFEPDEVDYEATVTLKQNPGKA